MSEFKVKLLYRCADGAGDGVVLQKTVQLPFVPTPLVSIGLEEDSEFGWSETKVEQVMFILPLEMFLVWLKGSSGKYAIETAESLIKKGWEVYMPCGFQTEKEARGSVLENELHSVVAQDGKFYPLSELERKIFDLQ